MNERDCSLIKLHYKSWQQPRFGPRATICQLLHQVNIYNWGFDYSDFVLLKFCK